jgi:hypothetical protein
MQSVVIRFSLPKFQLIRTTNFGQQRVKILRHFRRLAKILQTHLRSRQSMDGGCNRYKLLKFQRDRTSRCQYNRFLSFRKWTTPTLLYLSPFSNRIFATFVKSPKISRSCERRRILSQRLFRRDLSSGRGQMAVPSPYS